MPRKGQNVPPKYALIGCGKVAIKHLKAAWYQHSKQKTIIIAALVDINKEAALSLLKAAGIPSQIAASIEIYQDYQKMLSVVKPDFTAVTTPSGSHYEIGMAVLENQSHLLLEKPLTLSLAEADHLLAKATKHKLKISVGHIYRFFPALAKLQKDLRAGRFGQILYGDVKVRWGHDQAYYDQAAWRGTWQDDGGALMNQSIHALDLMIWLLGAAPLSVSGRIDRQQHRMEAEDLGFAIIELEQKIWCQLEGTTNTDPDRPEASFFIRCSQGEIRGGILSGRPYLQILDAKGKNIWLSYLRKFVYQQWRQGKLAALGQLTNPHSGLYQDWIQACLSDKEPLASGDSGRLAVEMVLAIYQSALERRLVQLPLANFELEQMQAYFVGEGRADLTNKPSY